MRIYHVKIEVTAEQMQALARIHAGEHHKPLAAFENTVVPVSFVQSFASNAVLDILDEDVADEANADGYTPEERQNIHTIMLMLSGMARVCDRLAALDRLDFDERIFATLAYHAFEAGDAPAELDRIWHDALITIESIAAHATQLGCPSTQTFVELAIRSFHAAFDSPGDVSLN